MATVNLYERISPETIRQLQEQVARFNENRNARNGYYAISIATPYRKYYGLWRVFPEGHPPVFLRTLSNQFTEAVQKAIDLLEYSKVALTWLDNSFFMPYYGNTYDILSFGKYHGKHLAEVYYVDPNYVLWLANKFDPEKKQLKQLVELAKDWRTDKMMKNLNALMIASDGDKIFTLSGAGDVFEAEYDVAGIGSGGAYALAAARAYLDAGVSMSAEEIARKSVGIAADICIYTNHNIIAEVQDGRV